MKKLAILLVFFLFFAIFSFGQNWDWTDNTFSNNDSRTGIWGVTHDYATSANTMLRERTYSTGYTSSQQLDFVSDPNVPGNLMGNDRDILIACHDGVGMVQWQTIIGGAGQERGQKIHITRNNELYVVGWFFSPQITIPAGMTTGGQQIVLVNQNNTGTTCDGFVMRIDPLTGNVIWANSFGGQEDDFGRDITSDHTDELFVIGDFQSNVCSFSNSGNTLNNVNAGGGSSDIVVMGYLLQTNNGPFIFANSYGGTGNDLGTGITSNALGFADVYFTGSFENAITIGGTNVIANNNTADAFVAHLPAPWNNANFLTHINSNGTETSAKIYQAITGGDLLVCGGYEGAVLNIDDLNGNVQMLNNNNLPTREGYILRINLNGAPFWSTQLAGVANELVRAIAFDGCGNVYTTGQYTSGFANTGGVGINGTPNIIKFFTTSHDYATGNPTWATTSTGNIVENGGDVEICLSNGIHHLDPIVVGSFVDQMQVPPLPNNTFIGQWNDAGDGFLMMYDEAPLITINQTGPFCETDPCVNLGFTIQPGGVWPAGTWAGPGITNPQTGQFCPQAAGNGFHTITYTIQWQGCNITGSTVIQVGNDPWPKQATAPTTNELSTGKGVAFDNNGGFYVTGEYEGQVTFHRANGTTVTLTSAGGSDAYLARYNECGIDWAISLGSSGNGERGTAVAFDPISGDMFWVGNLVGDFSTLTFSSTQFTGTLPPMPAIPLGQQRGFITKVSQSGIPSLINIPDPTNANVTSTYNDVKALTNSLGITTIYTVGTFNSTFQFNGVTVISNGGQDIFNGSYSTMLNEINSFSYGTGGNDFAMGMDIIHIQGTPTIPYIVDVGMASDQSGFFGMTNISASSTGSSDPFFALVDISAGLNPHIFGRIDGAGSTPGWGFAMDVCPISTSTQGPQANFAITGWFSSTKNFDITGGSTILTPPAQGSYIAAYDFNGALVWAIQGGGNGNRNFGTSLVEVPSTGSIYAVGHYSQTGAPVPGGLGYYLQGLPSTANANDQDFYYVDLDINGNLNAPPATFIQGSGQVDAINDIGFDGTNLYTTGQFFGNISFNNSLTSTGTTDMYFARMDLNRVHFLVAEEGEDSPSKPNEIGGTNGTSKTSEGSFDAELISKKIEGLSVYPNPSSTGIFNITSSSAIQKITVNDISGRTVYETSEINQMHHKVNLSSYAKGVYVLAIKTNNEIITKRVIR